MQVSRWDQSSEHDEADLNNLGGVPLTKSNKQQGANEFLHSFTGATLLLGPTVLNPSTNIFNLVPIFGLNLGY